MEHHNDFVRIEIMEAELEIEENISNRESVDGFICAKSSVMLNLFVTGSSKCLVPGNCTLRQNHLHSTKPDSIRINP